MFANHSVSWSSGNSGPAIRSGNTGKFELRLWELVIRGAGWHVASTRVTGRLSVPQIGAFAEGPACSVYIYDGAECMRALDENHTGPSTPTRLLM